MISVLKNYFENHSDFFVTQVNSFSACIKLHLIFKSEFMFCLQVKSEIRGIENKIANIERMIQSLVRKASPWELNQCLIKMEQLISPEETMLCLSDIAIKRCFDNGNNKDVVSLSISNYLRSYF